MITIETLERLLKNSILINYTKENIETFLNIYKYSLYAENYTQVIIITDYGYPKQRIAPLVAYSYALAAKKLSKKITILNIYDYTYLELYKFIEKIKIKSIVILCLSEKLKNTKQDIDQNNLIHKKRYYFKNVVLKNGHKYIYSTGLSSVKSCFFENYINTLNINFKELNNFSKKLKSLLDNAKKVRITTELGTDLYFNINNREALINDGYLKDFPSGNMPCGEVYIAPIEKKNKWYCLY